MQVLGTCGETRASSSLAGGTMLGTAGLDFGSVSD